MTPFQLLLICSILPTIALGVTCYAEVTTGKDKATQTRNCPNSDFCSKSVTTGTNGQVLNAYGCGLLCTYKGCQSSAGVTYCCCDSNYCNAASSTSATLLLAAIAFMRLLVL
ncbi:hypothetical protein Q1695_006603 [Nippostrongylus brasiliensis]|nr:hypothetical protein Q1695_006603 [Nippostrongylus brasiliensis]